MYSSRVVAELGTAATEGYEPYRPDMLPGRAPSAPQTPPTEADTASDAVNDLRRAGFQMQTQNGPPPGDTRPSLRESLLKKPLGSLYRKD